MKIHFLILAVLMTISLCSFSQKLSFKNLKGTWKETDSSYNTSLIFNFTDSSHGLMLVKDEVVGNFLYSIDNSFNPTHLLYTDSVTKKTDTWLVKVVSKDTLKIQSSADNKIPGTWDSNETSQNTGILVRQKN
jgi:hypothetical protein